MISITDNLAEFCSTRRVHAFAHKLGKGWEVQWSPPPAPDPDQEAFDRWEMSQRKNLFSWEMPKERKTPKENRRQQELKW